MQIMSKIYNLKKGGVNNGLNTSVVIKKAHIKFVNFGFELVHPSLWPFCIH